MIKKDREVLRDKSVSGSVLWFQGTVFVLTESPDLGNTITPVKIYDVDIAVDETMLQSGPMPWGNSYKRTARQDIPYSIHYFNLNLHKDIENIDNKQIILCKNS